MWFFERRWSGLQSSSFSDKEGLNSESVRLGSDIDFDSACSVTLSGMYMFVCSSMRVATSSTVMAPAVLRSMNATIGAMKELMERVFPPTLSAALAVLK